MGQPAIVFDGVWKKFNRAQRFDSLRDLDSGDGRPASSRRPTATSELHGKEFWALRDVSFEVAARRGARHHRPQRRRQVDGAQGADADSPRRRGASLPCTAASARWSRSPPASTPT